MNHFNKVHNLFVSFGSQRAGLPTNRVRSTARWAAIRLSATHDPLSGHEVTRASASDGERA